MKYLSGTLRKKLVKLKNKNPYLRYLWLKQLAKQKKKELLLDEKEAVSRLYYNRAQKVLDLDNPKAYTEKLQWLKLYYRNDLMPVLADKYLVRDYLNNLGLSNILNDLYKVYESVDDFNLDELPDKFVLKATHASGWNLIVKDKSKIDWWIWKKHMKYWLTHDIAWMGREWHYAEMTPRIICERYLEDESGSLTDYKCFCFNGEPKFIYVHVKGKEEFLNYYDSDWNLLPFYDIDFSNPNEQHDIQKPVFLDKILSLSAQLSKPFPFVRIDFYIENNNLRFGEFTFFPGSGRADIRPLEWDFKIGEWLTLPEANRKID